MNESLKTLKGWVKIPDGIALRVNSGPPPPGRDESSFGGPREGGRGGGGGRSFDNTNKVYVGNQAWSVDNLALETLFREQGNEEETKVVYDMESGRPRGFVFVTYNSTDEGNSTIDSLNGVDLDGRNIRVSVAEAHKCISFKKLKGVMRSTHELIFVLNNPSDLVLIGSVNPCDTCATCYNIKRKVMLIVEL
ncbi:hypothetical protein L1987_43194 [Smallanthus sonchifolius]|uniref:Uncharacterized protein n=1 Tax=Smallanthus sonchifolius TaxID=185202 RepID=A0ACB9GKY5_9ASTR|nr:hypothetical protein L1987_43194 [Smallanthus sonchifolius]